MARGNQAEAIGEVTADEQAQLDEMRAGDAPIVDEAPQDDAGQADPAPADAGDAEGADGAADPPQDRRPQMVPHAALHEERLRRQETERVLAEERKARQTIEERTNLLLERFNQPAQQQQPQQQQAPTFETDPAGHLLAHQRQQGEALNEVVRVLMAMGQQNQVAQNIGGLQQRAIAMEQEFAADTPDYNEAVAFLAKARHNDLAEVGYVDPGERQRMISQEAIGLVERSLQAGRNPASVVYALAKNRGFGAAPPAAATEQPVVTPPNGAARLQTVQRGQEQARTLGNTRGSAPPPLTAQRLLEMTPEEFETAMKTKAGQELLGA